MECNLTFHNTKKGLEFRALFAYFILYALFFVLLLHFQLLKIHFISPHIKPPR